MQSLENAHPSYAPAPIAQVKKVETRNRIAFATGVILGIIALAITVISAPVAIPITLDATGIFL